MVKQVRHIHIHIKKQIPTHINKILTAPIQLDTDLDSCNNQLDTLRQQIQAEETKLKNKNTQLATCRSNVTKAIAQLKDAKARSGR